MTKEEAIEALRALLKPGESVTVEGNGPASLTDDELEKIFEDHPGSLRASIRATVTVDRRREVERLRDKWGLKPINWHDVAEHLGVKVEP